MIKITYTEEMQENDRLWQEEKEDIELMLKLYGEIYNEAKEKGFTQLVEIYDAGNEGIVDVYLDEEDMELCRLGTNEPAGSFGYCKPFIEYIESILNS